MTQQGYYTDPPNRRVAYHLDGTRVFLSGSNFTSIEEISDDHAGYLNDSSSGRFYTGWYGGEGTYTSGHMTWLFPSKTDITHYHASCDGTGHESQHHEGAIEVSTDTTDGFDGTWTTVVSTYSNNEGGHSSHNGRESIHSIPNALGIRGIRVGWSGHSIWTDYHYLKYHLYGFKNDDTLIHRVFFCDANGNDFIRSFDFGDRPSNEEYIWEDGSTFNQSSALYVKNNSPEKIARDVHISFGGTRSTNLAEDLRLSKDSSNYFEDLTISEIERGEIYGPIWLKRNAVVGEGVGLKQATMMVQVGFWSDPDMDDIYVNKLGFVNA